MTAKAARILGTWFGCGLSPVAPGTAGSLGALAVAWLLEQRLQWGAREFAVLAACLFAPAVWAAHRTALQKASKDPQEVVIDEVIGQWVALAGVAVLNWKGWLGAFLLFRLFDIWKPFPVRRAERLPGGLGIVADDVVAGIYAALVMSAAGWFNFY